jgi:hypothetical protein
MKLAIGALVLSRYGGLMDYLAYFFTAPAWTTPLSHVVYRTDRNAR